MPFELKLIKEGVASSTIYQTNWTAPNDYISKDNIYFINGNDDIKLLFSGPGIFVADQQNHRIVRTNMNGSIWLTYGTQGSGIGQFNRPQGICYDYRTGDIYITDSHNHRIVKTKIDGTGWTTYGTQGNGTGQFLRPSGINYDSSTGYIYVADVHNNRIVKTMMNGSGWTTYGTTGSGTGEFDVPFGLSYDSSTGFIYVGDYDNNRIVRTKMDGTGWATYGTWGSGTGQFGTPTYIFYDSSKGDIYVSDRDNHRIVKTKMDGSGWTTYGSQGTGKGQFNYPYGIQYDNKTNYVYVIEAGCRIIKTMMNGSGWTSYGSLGSGKGQFRYPIGGTIFSGGYYQNGFLESCEFYFGGQANLLTLSWSADSPSNTTVKFQLRTGTDLTDLNSKDFVGPNGKTDKYYNKSGVSPWSGHDGDQLVQYKVYLSTNNLSITPILKDVTLTYNLLPNCPILISPADGARTNENTTTFTWSFNDADSTGQRAFQWQLDDDKNFSDIDYDSNEVISSKSSFTPNIPIADGSWYWRIRTMDSDDDWGPFSLPWKIIIDSISPTSKILFPKNNTFYNKITTLKGKATDPEISTGLNKVEISINRLIDDFYWTGQKGIDTEYWLITSGIKKWSYGTSSVIWHSGFKYNIQSRATDNATNIEIPKPGRMITMDFENVTFSNAIPSLTDELTAEDVEVGITIADQISGVNASTIEYILSEDEGNTWTAWEPVIGLENGKSVNVTLNLILPNGTGNRIKWRASDLAGNGPNESISYIINVNTWQREIINPKVSLWSPPNGSIIQTTSVELIWRLENQNLLNVTYYVYLDTINPPNATKETGLKNTSLLVTDLSDGETYYWTVIPNVGTDAGWCMSGIWTFAVDTSVPVPSVTLSSPENGSIISSIKPTLSWSVEYKGAEILSYDVYLDTNEAPVEYEKCPNTYFLSRSILKDNRTYYWKVAPWAGNVRGPESETWSFTVKKDYRPRIELKLTVNPPYLEQVPGDVVSVQATVYNLGELVDTITLNVDVPPDADISAVVTDPGTMNAISDGTAKFNITLTIAEDAKKGEVVLTVTAVSGRADEYDLVVEENAELTVKIFGIDKPETDRSSTLFTYLNILFIIIIIIIILALAIYVNKRRKRDKEKKSNKEAVTLKPGEHPTAVISVGQAPAAAQLPGSVTANVAQELPTTTSTTPVLVSSPSAAQAPVSQQIPQVARLPQLPPAQTQATKPVAIGTTPVPTIAASTPIPTPAVRASEAVPVSAQEPRETDNAHPQEQDKEVSGHQNKNQEPY